MDKENKKIVRVKNLTKKYGDFIAVNDISFEVKKGQVFAFLGPNGAGKSTTIKMLTTLLRPTQGSIEISGHDTQKNQDAVRRSFGIVFQDPSLDDELTAYENMYFHAGLYGVKKNEVKEKIEKLLTLFELIERENTLVKNFSGGMKRRLEIARCLLHEPQILFLDEPTLGLDPQTRAKLWQHVMKLNHEKQMTVFLTTHYIEEAEKMAEQVAIIDHGKILMRGTVEELKSKTNTNSLEDAFLELTGRGIREEAGNQIDRMRQFRNVKR